MDIATDGHWGTHWLHVALLNKNLLDLFAEDAEVALGQDTSVLHSCEPGVDVRFSGHNVVSLFYGGMIAVMQTFSFINYNS